MNLEPDMTIELAVATAQQDIIELQGEYKELHKFVTGNGDPEHGLLWMSTLQGRLITDLTAIVEANRQAVLKADDVANTRLLAHEQVHEIRRSSGTWARLGFEVSKGVLLWIIVGFLAFTVANVHITIGGVK